MCWRSVHRPANGARRALPASKQIFYFKIFAPSSCHGMWGLILLWKPESFPNTISCAPQTEPTALTRRAEADFLLRN